MKLTVIGGASVRTPRFIPALARRAERLGLQELWLMDIDEHKLDLMGALCLEIAKQHHIDFKIILSSDPQAAIKDADHIITTIRPGKEQGRVFDERIAFKHGVLGQETTGAGGFAMAMRSLPSILAYCQMAADLAPRAWIYNFTNPAGLVAQGLHDAGIKRIVGICDSANGAQHAASRFLGIPNERIRHEVFGLNHLSWTRSVKIDVDANGQGGEEVLPSLLGNPEFISSTHMSMFHPIIIQQQGMFLNEYLHYFYHRDEALKALLAKSETRGEEIVRLTGELLDRLEEINPSQHPQAALTAYHELMGRRGATYMAHARGGAERKAVEQVDDDEGYAGVALGCVEAIALNTTHYTGLNVPNNGTIAGLADDDVVEVNCRVDGEGIHPLPVGAIPEDQYVLTRTVKRYERLAAQAILQRSKSLAVEALATHPLIGSYPLAIKLVDDFLEAHHENVGTWS
ncbi:MAG: 6-phospho-beta-glucosidase [Chloroflexi bacterium]|nr:6-phospho-beta-glucosidase [Chloroflexota bacterium]MCC6891615.1 6-phospho-beta-glucosidase [Anaerolineae bacterium]